MSQNRSSAVMAQRVEPHDSLDDFPTPPWATRALMEHVLHPVDRNWRIWEPACGRGYMADALREYCPTVLASDIHCYGVFAEVRDFLWHQKPYEVDWIITNPPYRLAQQFAERALDIAKDGVALLVRTQFLEGISRYEQLFSKAPPILIAQFTERVPMVKGRVDPKISTASSYCWLVWMGRVSDQVPQFIWIPPCRKQLERPSDYAAVQGPRQWRDVEAGR